jgi:hypothetical protein
MTPAGLQPRAAGSLVLALVIGITSTADAQERRIQVSADVMVGSGLHTEQAGNVWYHYNRSMFGSVAIALTFPGRGRLHPLLGFDRSSTIAGDAVAICGLAPNGTCRQYFPGLAGYSAGAGIRAHLINALALDLSGGLGSMSGPSRHVAANLAFALSRHARIVAGARYIVIHHSSGNKLWWFPVSAGLRVQ